MATRCFVAGSAMSFLPRIIAGLCLLAAFKGLPSSDVPTIRRSMKRRHRMTYRLSSSGYNLQIAKNESCSPHPFPEIQGKSKHGSPQRTFPKSKLNRKSLAYPKQRSIPPKTKPESKPESFPMNHQPFLNSSPSPTNPALRSPIPAKAATRISQRPTSHRPSPTSQQHPYSAPHRSSPF